MSNKNNSYNNDKSISQKKRKKKLQNLVDTKSRPKLKRGCQHDVKIIDFVQKKK